MKLLELCSKYPDMDGSTAGMFFHVRNLYYSEKGIKVNVINFSSVKDYEKDGIKVFSINKYEESLKDNQYNLFICYAPHISHHYEFLKKHAYKYNNIVFVSNWMYDMFMKHAKIDPKKIEERKHIIYNSIGKNFENEHYNLKIEKIYDFITVRVNLDGFKYGIDIVNRIASMNPQYKFRVIGKGEFLRYNMEKNKKYFSTQTINKEVALFGKVMKRINQHE